MPRRKNATASNNTLAPSDSSFVNASAEVLLSTRPKNWSAYLSSGSVASNEFMENVEELPTQEREF
jgi:hypothetical protein